MNKLALRELGTKICSNPAEVAKVVAQSGATRRQPRDFQNTYDINADTVRITYHPGFSWFNFVNLTCTWHRTEFGHDVMSGVASRAPQESI